MGVPAIWIVEDEDRHRALLKRLLGIAFGHCVFREFGDASQAVLAASQAGPGSVDLMLVDLLIPAGGHPTTHALPGIDVIEAVRSSAIGDVPIIVRTGFEEAVPISLLDERTVRFAKGGSPIALLDVAGSMLAVRGFPIRQSVQELSPLLPVGAGPQWLAPSMVVGASAIAASLWVASVLQVTSERSPVGNAVLVSIALLGGALAASSRFLNDWRRLAVLATGMLVVAAAGLVLPTLPCGW